MKYYAMLDRSSDQNRFRACFYNKSNLKELEPDLKRLVQEYVPLQVNGDQPVDLDKWLKAVEANPDRSKLIPTQIGSVTELKARITHAKDTFREAKERLAKSVENLSVVEGACESDLQKHIEKTKQANGQLRSYIARVFGKFESLLSMTGRADTNRDDQDVLIEKQNELLARLTGIES